MTTILSRVSKIMIKEVELLNVKSFTWKENNGWVTLEIPGGTAVHQQIIPHQVEGTIVCMDTTTLWTALYTSGIIDEETGEVTTFSETGEEFEVTMKDLSGNDVVFDFYSVRIQTLDPGPIVEEGSEAVWTVKFTADKVIKQ